MKIGQRLIVTFPDSDDLPDSRAEVLDGPVSLGGKSAWKVRIIDERGGELWVPQDWMRPLMKAVE